MALGEPGSVHGSPFSSLPCSLASSQEPLGEELGPLLLLSHLFVTDVYDNKALGQDLLLFGSATGLGPQHEVPGLWALKLNSGLCLGVQCFLK